MGSYVGRGKRYPFLQSVQTNSPEAHPASYSMGMGGSFSREKREGRNVDYWPLSSVKITKWVKLRLYSPYLQGVSRKKYTLLKQTETTRNRN